MHKSFLTTAPHLPGRVGKCRARTFLWSPQCGGSTGVITSRQNRGLRILTPLEKYFKEYSMYVLMEFAPKGEGVKAQGYNYQFVPTV